MTYGAAAGRQGVTADRRRSRRGQAELRRRSCRRCGRRAGPRRPAGCRSALGGDFACTTVVTILTRLLARARSRGSGRAGRSCAWTPVSDEADLAARKMRTVLDAKSDRQAVLASSASGPSRQRSNSCGGRSSA
ncbi:BlaI/MecI/CopY family transcriptional regulator [Streptomyces sp. NPDC058145]|uniref:BlaI/MecI/CopY family transcriptional regulator n=1 Tax=Streptomyces sp. NPDC058145 TaxID=3346356 RepID=UPI0036DFEBBD